MSLLDDPKFKYRSAEESLKPGYLARRFAQIRREQLEAEKKAEETKQEQVQKVRKLEGRK